MKTFTNKLLMAALFGWLLLATGCGREEHPALSYEVKGIDVSRYQEVVDWRAVAEDGVQFVFAKATEGGDHRDHLFTENWQSLRDHRLRRGAYHFFRPEVAALTQAKNFIDQVGDLLPGDLPPVLDLEVRGIDSHENYLEKIRQWCDFVEARYGMRPILYSGQVFYNRHLAGQFTGHPVWIARYKDEQPSLADGRSYQFWQYGDTGQVAGINGPVDVNIFTGSHLDLALMSMPPSAIVGAPEVPLATTK